MFEETGQRPIVYKNKCGQLCGVNFLVIQFDRTFSFSVVQKKFVEIDEEKNEETRRTIFFSSDRRDRFLRKVVQSV